MLRTLFIGLDGATFTILDQLTSDLPGTGVVMPFMRRFMASGARAKLRSTPNPLTPPAWTSIMTGRSPGNHGIFDFIRAEEKEGKIYFTLYDSRDIRTETIWSIISRSERSVVSLNFPVTAPPRRINGALVPGFVPWKHLRRNTTPQELYERLAAIPDFDPKSLAWDFDREKQAVELLAANEVEDWVAYHLPREKQWFTIADFLLKQDQPDLMAVMFDGTDKIQHQAWAFIDVNLMPAEPSPYAQRMRKLCLDYYRELDGYIEALVTAAGPTVQVFMASDHGFTATTEVVRINTFLHQKGHLHWAKTDDSEASRRRENSQFANIDWDRTLAYCRTPSSNGITIRVASAPGEPGIRPDEYEAFRERLIQDLQDLRDEHTGERVVREIMKREDVFAGTAMLDAPDLTLVLRDYGFVSIRNAEPVVMPRESVAGTHHPDGVFLAGGRGVKPGTEVELLNIVDVAPTLLYSLGLPVPEDFEGSVPRAFFSDEFLRFKPVRIGKATLPVSDGQAESEEIGQDEKDKLIEQLQMLGYME